MALALGGGEMTARPMILLLVLLFTTGCGQSDDDSASASSEQQRMSEEANAAAIQLGFQLVNEAVRYALEHPEDTAGRQRNLDAIVARHVGGMGEGYVDSSPREGLWGASEFPDRQFTIDEQTVEGNTVWTRHTVRGTHLGEWQGLAPTGAEFTVSAVLIQRIEDGLVAHDWDLYDHAGLLEQLGAVAGN